MSPDTMNMAGRPPNWMVQQQQMREPFRDGLDMEDDTLRERTRRVRQQQQGRQLGGDAVDQEDNEGGMPQGTPPPTNQPPSNQPPTSNQPPPSAPPANGGQQGMDPLEALRLASRGQFDPATIIAQPFTPPQANPNPFAATGGFGAQMTPQGAAPMDPNGNAVDLANLGPPPEMAPPQLAQPMAVPQFEGVSHDGTMQDLLRQLQNQSGGNKGSGSGSGVGGGDFVPPPLGPFLNPKRNEEWARRNAIRDMGGLLPGQGG